MVETHYDAEKKQMRSKRKLIGKLDSDGQIVATGAIGRPLGSTKPKSDSSSSEIAQHYEALLNRKEEDLRRKDERINTLTNALTETEKTLRQYKAAVKKMEQIWSALPE